MKIILTINLVFLESRSILAKKGLIRGICYEQNRTWHNKHAIKFDLVNLNPP